MSQELTQEQLIRSYLLGELPESEQELIEELLVTDQSQDFFDKFLIVEGTLLDDYVLGLITKQERARLERGLLRSPHQYRKVEFVKTLEEYIAHTKATSEEVQSNVSSSKPPVFTRLRSWLFDSGPAPVLQDIKVDAAESKPSYGEVQEHRLWKEKLSEAHANRSLILSLMNDRWLGLELLLQLKAVQPATPANLAFLLDRDAASLVVALTALSDFGLVYNCQGEYSCSETGEDILEKLRSIITPLKFT